MALTSISTGGIKDAQITAGKLHADALDRTYTLGADGSNHYTFTGEGLTGAVNDPTLYLTRGKTYRFVNGNSAGAHPFRIQTTVNGSAGTEYNTGVTNNGGAGGSTIIFEVPHDAPDVLYYQCTSHGSMGGILYVTGALADGTVTTAKLADQAVTLAKLPHGTSSNDGKFLRANNGADPTFETVSGTTINNNADNRVITGSNTANTLNGETNVHVTSDKLLIGTSNVNNGLPYTISGAIQTLGAYNTSSINIVNNENSGNTSALTFNKVRGASGGVSATDNMGGINWGAWDGVAWRSGITVEGKLTGSGANNVPSKLTFKINSGSSNTERFAITPNGVTFNGDTAANNSLDDYEIGNWTPSCSSGTFTIYNQAWYIKIGKLVTCYFYIYNFSDTSSTTHFVIGGLPFAYNNSPKHESFHNICVGGNSANMNSSCIGIMGRIGQGSTTEMQLQQERYNNTSVNFEHRHLGSCHLHTTFCYEAA